MQEGSIFMRRHNSLTYNKAAHQRGCIRDWVIVPHPPAPDVWPVFKLRARDTDAVRDRAGVGEASVSFPCVRGLMSLGRWCCAVIIEGPLWCLGSQSCVHRREK